MSELNGLKNELNKYANQDKVGSLEKFFQAVPGGYGEGDKFISVKVPNQRKVARKFKNLSLGDVEALLTTEIHEYRLTALFILVNKFEKAKPEVQGEIVKLYLKNVDRINNWDLVDSSAHKILGPYLIDRDKKQLYDYARTDHLWKQRIAMLTTYHFIKNDRFEDALAIADILLSHKHDLIHKAVGWMLREIGNRNQKVEKEFLRERYQKMPRTMLRYAIEKFEKDERQKYLKGEI